MKIRGLEPVLILVAVALMWWGSQEPPLPDKPDPAVASSLLEQAGNEVTVAGYVLADHGGTWYALTVTAPMGPAAQQNVHFWQSDSGRDWRDSHDAQANALVGEGDLPQPAELDLQWFRSARFPEEANRKLRAQKWTAPSQSLWPGWRREQRLAREKDAADALMSASSDRKQRLSRRIIVQNGDDWYAATVSTSPLDPPGRSTTTLWQRDREGSWIPHAQHENAPPEPAEIPTEWFDESQFPESARERIRAAQWQAVGSAEPDRATQEARYTLMIAANRSGEELLGRLVVEDEGKWYGATVTMPDAQPGLKNTALWRLEPEGWISGGLISSTIGPPPEPDKFSDEGFDRSGIPESARQKIRATQWEDMRP